MEIGPKGENDDDSGNLEANLGFKRVSCQIKDGAKEENGEIESGKIVMKEELTVH